MLLTVLKQEFKSTARFFVLAYAVLIILSVVSGLILPLVARLLGTTAGVVGASGMSGASIGLIALFVAMPLSVGLPSVLTFVIVVSRFYRLFGDEGYLWFTLPVSANAHILGKLLASAAWFFASWLVSGLCMLLISLHSVIGTTSISLPVFIGLDSGTLPSLLVSIASSAVSVFSGILLFYASIAIGPHLSKSRLGGTVMAFVGFVLCLLLAGYFITMPMTSAAMAVFGQADWHIVFVGIIDIGMNIAAAAALYALVWFFMSKKLNLE
jgi:hypothetical protein